MDFVPNTDRQRESMLEAIGVGRTEDLFADVPPAISRPTIKLPPPLSEMEIMADLRSLAGGNTDTQEYACFLGGGAYHHFIPTTVSHIISRNEFYSCYTPYQAEVSQGTLQAMFEYQSLICDLTGMEVANASHYDGATALAEAALMAVRITGRRRVAAMAAINPQYIAVLRTYTQSQDISIDTIPEHPTAPMTDYACIIAQHPNSFGNLEDVFSLAKSAHQGGTLLVAVVDPISLGFLKPPGEYDADIAVGEGQSLGNTLSFGGPYVGIFTCKEAHIRQMPGRIVGQTTDHRGRRGFVLTLQTREQHIRRERATSNICTSQSLAALASTVYLSIMGKEGLRKVAEMCYHKAHYAADRITRINGYNLAFGTPFFKEFALRCPLSPSILNQHLLRYGIIGGLDISLILENTMLLCVTEMNTREEIDRLVRAMTEIGNG